MLSNQDLLNAYHDNDTKTHYEHPGSLRAYRRIEAAVRADVLQSLQEKKDEMSSNGFQDSRTIGMITAIKAVQDVAQTS